MKARLLTTSLADEQFLSVVAWWRENRPAAPYLFEEEVGEAFELLEHEPEVGRCSPLPDLPNARRLILRKTAYHMYYEYNPALGEVWVHAIWSAIRGRGPDLKRR